MAFDMANMEEEMKSLRKQASDKFELERKYHQLQTKYEEFKGEMSVSGLIISQNLEQFKVREQVKGVEIEQLNEKNKALSLILDEVG